MTYKDISGRLDQKRLIVIFVVIVLWVLFGIVGAVLSVPFTALSVYFVSLTGFVSTYIYAESVRGSSSSSIFKSGQSSTREMMMYSVIALWSAMAVTGFLFTLDFVEMAAYFAVLTPFVGAYMISKTHKPNDPLFNAQSAPIVNQDNIGTNGTQVVEP